MAPQMRIILNPPMNPTRGQFKVIVDDGEDNTDDTLDISELFTFSSGVGVASIPATVPINTYQGPNQAVFRALFDDPGTVRIMYYGENRLRFYVYGALCFEAWFLHYEAADTTVVGTYYSEEQVPAEPSSWMATEHILLVFNPDAETDTTISQFLEERLLRPQGISRDVGALQVRAVQSLRGQSLVGRVSQLDSDMLSRGGGAAIDKLGFPRAVAGETYTAPFNADFEPATGDWRKSMTPGRIEPDARHNHHEHWEMQTFAAHRLADVERARNPGNPVDMLIYDTGFADGDDFSAAPASRNEYFIAGERLVRATRITQRYTYVGVGEDIQLIWGRTQLAVPSEAGNPGAGDVRNVRDTHSLGHGTPVASLAVGDWIGNGARDINNIVLGTGKDARVRVVTSTLDRRVTPSFAQLALLKAVELATRDTLVRVFSLSYGFFNLPAASKTAQIRKFRALSESGTLIVLAAGNDDPPDEPGVDISKTEGGHLSATNNVPRADLAGADAFKRNVLAVGFAAYRPAANQTEARNAGSKYGRTLSVSAPGDNVLLTEKTGRTPRIDGGTSFAAPVVAGIAAEMMLANPSLQWPANITKVAEMIEATSDDIGPAGLDDETGHGRVHFWKAMLAAVNGGLSAEGHFSVPDGQGGFTDQFFKRLTLIGEPNTKWYGFEVRANHLQPNAGIWLKRRNVPANPYVQVQDAGQSRPALAGANLPEVPAYVSTQKYETPAGRILPPLPFSVAEFANPATDQQFVARFSLERGDLLDKDELAVVPAGLDPNQPGVVPILTVPLTDMADLRRGQAAVGPNAAAIRAVVRYFDDFVFHVERL